MMTLTAVQTRTLTLTEPSLKSGQIRIEEEKYEAEAIDVPDLPLPPPSKQPTEILAVDKGTPDNHVPRDSRLIRLTGVHPFNVEPPLTALYNEGILPGPPFSCNGGVTIPHISFCQQAS